MSCDDCVHVQMNPYKERDLGSEYQQGIFDMLRGAKDLWLQSGMGLLNPNNPVYKKTPQPKNYDDIRGLLDDPDLEYLPSLDPGSFMRGMTKVFHGSPHLFKNWDFSKMGSGEGAQAFGHGGYFAGSKGVGEYYRDQFSSPRKASLSGKPIGDWWDEITDEMKQLINSAYDDIYNTFKTERTNKIKELDSNLDQIIDEHKSLHPGTLVRDVRKEFPDSKLTKHLNKYDEISNEYISNIKPYDDQYKQLLRDEALPYGKISKEIAPDFPEEILNKIDFLNKKRKAIDSLQSISRDSMEGSRTFPKNNDDLIEELDFHNIFDDDFKKYIKKDILPYFSQGKAHLYEIELKPDPEDFPMYSVPLEDQPMAMDKINAAKNRVEALKKERDWTLSQIDEKKKQPGYVSDLPDELKWADDMLIPYKDIDKLKPIEDEIQKLESALFIVDHPNRSIMDRESPRDLLGYKTPEWKPAAEIAEAFRTVGFPGHRFLDGASRSGKRSDKNYNYVVYPTDEADMIKITNPPKSLLD